jgi:S-adenosylmethionine:tRNA ribosyltransferase-isomerase
MAGASLTVDLMLPEALAAAAPPEARGLRRDDVRLLVSNVIGDTIDHARFRDLPRFLRDGDILVVNTSGTLKAALEARAVSNPRLELHLSTALPGGFWSVEVRIPDGVASQPHRASLTGEQLRLADDGIATILAPYPLDGGLARTSRLWLAALQLPEPISQYLDRHGFPIRYDYVPGRWDASHYQTVFATEPGSAEMPSAGRPFTPELVATLVARGVQIAPMLLHTGVSSLEDHEPPYEEFFRVSGEWARRFTAARRSGSRIIAVGTTVVRALETVTDDRGITSAGQGWTDVVISPSRPVRSVNGIITGLHEPRATHLMLLEQVVAAARRSAATAGRSPATIGDPIGRAYTEALARGYFWHEFGDSHLIVGAE